MTDYKAIADRLVERGILTAGDGLYTLDKELPAHVLSFMPAKTMCNDWRVAGACMERLDAIECATIPANRWQVMCAAPGECYDSSRYVHNKSLPLAIILAYLEGTDGDGSH